MISISKEQLDLMRAHAEAGYPNEACGLLVGEIEGQDRRVIYAVPMRNAWTPPEGEGDAGAQHDMCDRYLIPPDEHVRVDREAGKRGLDIIGSFHSHPDWPSRASETDRELAWENMSYIIISVQNGRAASLQSWALNAERQFVEEALHIEPLS